MGRDIELFAVTHGTIVVFAMLLCCCVAVLLLCCHCAAIVLPCWRLIFSILCGDNEM